MTDSEFITQLLRKYKKTLDKDSKVRLKRIAADIPILYKTVQEYKDLLQQYKDMLQETADLDDTISDLMDIGSDN